MSTHSEFFAERLGKNWVIVNRRSAQPRFDSRGFEQRQVTRAEYAKVERSYREIYGDPYDKQRAALYLTLREVMGNADVRKALSQELINRALDVLVAESGA